MGRRAIGEVSEFSRRLARAVQQASREAGVSNAELVTRVSFSANYLYSRLRGDAPFNTNDLAEVAAALNLAPLDLVRRASAVDEDQDARIKWDGRELSRRLSLLAGAPDLETAEPFSLNRLVEDLTASGLGFSAERWTSLLDESSTTHVSAKLLAATAAFFHVEAEYLTNPRLGETAQRIEAELELQNALRATGATAVAARALGDASPAALRAISRAILSIDQSGESSMKEQL